MTQQLHLISPGARIRELIEAEAFAGIHRRGCPHTVHRHLRAIDSLRIAADTYGDPETVAHAWRAMQLVDAANQAWCNQCPTSGNLGNLARQLRVRYTTLDHRALQGDEHREAA